MRRRRSSLIVNLSTTKKRSSVTTSSLLSESSSYQTLGHFGGSRSSFGSARLVPLDASSCGDMHKSGDFSDRMEAGDSDEAPQKRTLYLVGPQSAPPSLAKPHYGAQVENKSATAAGCVGLGQPATETGCTTAAPVVVDIAVKVENSSDNHYNSSSKDKAIKRADSCKEENKTKVIEHNQTNHCQQQTFQPVKVEEVAPGNSVTTGRRTTSSKENSPEPIVEIKHTSSSESIHSSRSASNSSSSSADRDSSTKLVRRRTVRRYHRATEEHEEEPSTHRQNEEETDLERSRRASLGRSQEQVTGAQATSHYRTRQIGSFQNQQAKQQTSSLLSSTSSSKIARCSITTNRKSTTSHKLVSSSAESSLRGSNLSLNKSSADPPSKVIEEQQVADKGSVHNESNKRGGLSAPIRTSMELNLGDPLATKNHFKEGPFDRRTTTLANGYLDAKRRIEVEQEEESSVHHRQSFSKTSTSTREGIGGLRKAAVSSSSSAMSEAAHVSRHLSHRHQDGTSSSISADLSASSSRHFATSASLIVSGNEQSSRIGQVDDETCFQNQDSLFSSPYVRSLVKEIGTDFAELENAMSRPTGVLNQQQGVRSSLSSRLFGGRRLLSPISPSPQYPAIASSSSGSHNLFESAESGDRDREFSGVRTTYGQVSGNLDMRRDNEVGNLGQWKGRYKQHLSGSTANEGGRTSFNGDRIQELLTRVRNHTSDLPETNTTQFSNIMRLKDGAAATNQQLAIGEKSSASNGCQIEPIDEVKMSILSGSEERLQSHRKSVMTESIERIDQRMSDLCKKFGECRDTKEAIELLKIMIQMIEKAWSVPVCGDDLGFKLCSSLREAGGLDIILGFIQDSDEQGLLTGQADIKQPTRATVSPDASNDDSAQIAPVTDFRRLVELDLETGSPSIGAHQKGMSSTGGPLRLNLFKTSDQSNAIEPTSPPSTITQETQAESRKQTSVAAATTVKDSDSDILTSDLGLDSTSVESLSCAAALARDDNVKQIENKEGKQGEPSDADQTAASTADSKEAATSGGDVLDLDQDVPLEGELVNKDAEEEAELRKDELVFLSSRLLSQCLTSENRNYIVENGLHPVIKLACSFTTMKSNQCQRLLSRSKIMRQSSTVAARKISKSASQQMGSNDINSAAAVVPASSTQMATAISGPICQTASAASKDTIERTDTQQQQLPIDNSDMHAIIGTEILQHLFKHSEATCSRIISLGGLEAILYGCRSSNTDILRHCASALVNLALYGGSDSQQSMIEKKAHVWLFPLAFNEDDNIQYYACLAIVVLVANQEIEADVLKSSTLDLVEPFVTSHEPQKFAESTTSHIHGQSASWLRKLVPLLESKREEARNLACFHFAMEAHIKREQGQTQVFKDIGAVEPLRRVASSPQPIASKFACQALRLIGEREPHRLSQQVPLWTNEDVLVWVGQIPQFEQFKAAFRDSCVDGDLLLQLDNDMLRADIGIENGILRRRFLRELANLKRIADYSSVDKSGLCAVLGCNGRDFVQYIYPMLQLGVTKDNIHLLDSEQLLRDCNVSNTVHRLKLAHSIKQLQDRMASAAASSEQNSFEGANEKTLDVFLSYRRATGSQLASLLKVHLQLRGFSVFIDVERLEAGKFDNNLLDSIKTAKNFILVLSPSALDRCIGDLECKDWVHKEIVAALASDCNIIPIMDGFHWPEAEQLPEDMRSISYFNGVRWSHDYQDACVDKVERFIRGELHNGAGASGPQGSSVITYCSTPSIVATPSITSFPNTGSTSNYSIRQPPFDSDHHPLSFSSPFLQQHSQTLPQTTRR